MPEPETRNMKTFDREQLRRPPRPHRMIDVVANLGHNLEVAVADLIDNSIAAAATSIDVTYLPPDDRGRWLAIADNGRGMNPEELLEAMTFGSEREYVERDLGRYGIGLKSASLSQANVLTVASRTESSEISVLRWDKDHVGRRGEWELIQPDLEHWEAEALLRPLDDHPGTVVLWRDVIPPSFRRRTTGSATAGHGQELDNLSLHLGMVFHRFMTGKARGHRTLRIRLNDGEVEAWDPFIQDHPSTRHADMFMVEIQDQDGRKQPVLVEAYILPRREEFDRPGDHRTAGFLGWNAMQGFYIYRSDRLIQTGGWCDIWREDEHLKLLRCAVMFDPELDLMFDINVAKMSVVLPPALRRQLEKRLKNARREARSYYNRKPAPPPGPRPEPGGAPATPALPTGPGSGEGPPAGGPAPGDTPSPDAIEPRPDASSEAEPSKLEIRPIKGRAWKIREDMTGREIVVLNSALPGMDALAGSVRHNSEARQALVRLLTVAEAALEQSEVCSDSSELHRMMFERLGSE